MLWITSPFIVKLSDVSPLRKPPCQSNICSKILSCSELPCFQKAVTLFTPAENLSQEILQGQGLIGQRAKCHPRGAIAMKTLSGVSPDVSEACCFPKSRNRTSLFCSAEYYFAVNFMFSPLSEVMMLLNFHLLFHWLCLPNAKCWKGLHKLIYPELANVCLGDMCSCWALFQGCLSHWTGTVSCTKVSVLTRAARLSGLLAVGGSELARIATPAALRCSNHLRRNGVWSVSPAYWFLLDFLYPSAHWCTWYITHWSQQCKNGVVC